MPDVPRSYVIPAWADPQQASVTDSNLTKALRWIGSVIGADSPSAQALATMTPMDVGEGGGVIGAVQRFIKAYHGSPADFQQFSTAHIGTGEGAQAYGHGLYFAENPAVAADYRQGLSTPTVEIAGQSQSMPAWHSDLSPQSMVIRRLGDKRMTLGANANEADVINAVRADIQRDYLVSSNRGDDHIANWAAKQSAILEDAAQRGIKTTPGGHMYEVAIKSDPAQFLDWDKSLSQQPPNVQALVQKLYPEHFADMKHASDLEVQIKALADQYGKPGDSYKAAIARAPDSVQQQWQSLVAQHASLSTASPGVSLPTTGEDIYRQLPDRMADMGLAPRLSTRSAQEDAAMALRDAGVPGIKYLDQGSRAAGQGTSNYVVFDDKTIEILKKYGLLLPLAGGAVASQQSGAQQ